MRSYDGAGSTVCCGIETTTRGRSEVLNSLTGEITIYASINRAADAMGCSAPNVLNRLYGITDSLIKGKYKVKAIV